MTLTLFAVAAAGIAFVWNRSFTKVPVRIALLFALLTIAYESATLFSSKVDLPALSYNSYPWQSIGKKAAHANTGIVFTQLAPWTNAARRSLSRHELPLWNR